MRLLYCFIELIAYIIYFRAESCDNDLSYEAVRDECFKLEVGAAGLRVCTVEVFVVKRAGCRQEKNLGGSLHSLSTCLAKVTLQ